MKREAIFSTFLVILLSACLAPQSDSQPQESDSDGLRFEWRPDEGESQALFYAVLETSNADCDVNIRAEGSFNHESKLGGHGREWTSENLAMNSALYSFANVHAEPVTTVPAMNDVYEMNPVTQRWLLGGGGAFTPNDTYQAAYGLLDLDPDLEDPIFSIDCEGGHASLRFYVAQDWVPIHSSTAHGGSGASLAVPPVFLGVNRGDIYTLETDADLAVLTLQESRRSNPGDLYHAEGRHTVTTPTGSAVLTYERDGEPFWWDYWSTWEETGTYTVEIDRTAVNHGPLVGFLAAVDLVEEIST